MSRREWLEAMTILGLPLPLAACASRSTPVVQSSDAAVPSASTESDASNQLNQDSGACADDWLKDAGGNWIEVSVGSLPALETVGGVVFDDDASLVHVWIVRLADGCYRAIWRICTHGACEVDFNSAEQQFVCPCHHSRFSLDGGVLQGPAVRGLRALRVVRVGDSLMIERPFI